MRNNVHFNFSTMYNFKTHIMIHIIGNCWSNKRQSMSYLIFNMAILILARRHLYIEMPPGVLEFKWLWMISKTAIPIVIICYSHFSQSLNAHIFLCCWKSIYLYPGPVFQGLNFRWFFPFSIVNYLNSHIQAETKWLPFCRHFRVDFLVWILQQWVKLIKGTVCEKKNILFIYNCTV